MTARLTKPVLAVLEQCFVAENSGRMFPVARWRRHEGTKAVQKAAELGLIERAEIVTEWKIIHGWRLTPAGHLAWCEACRDTQEPDE